MKLLISLLLISVFVFSSCGEDKKDNIKNSPDKELIDYNGRIMEEYTNITNGLGNLNRVLQSGDTVLVTTIHKGLLETIDSSIYNVENTPPYEGDSSLKVSAIELFSFYREIMEDKYSEFITLQLKIDEEFTPADSVRSLQIADSIDIIQYHKLEEFRNTQEEFLERHKTKEPNKP